MIKEKRKPKTKRPVDLKSSIEENTFSVDFDINQKFDLSDKQKDLCKKIIDKQNDIVFIKGPAGTAKTYIAIYSALSLLKMRAKDSILYIRSAVESSKRKIGFLPGEEGDKFKNYTLPFLEKSGELLKEVDFKNLMRGDRISFESTCFIRGRTFIDTVVIIDEAQNLTKEELLTLMTRIGKGSKLLIIGDTMQSDINCNDFGIVFNAFNTDANHKNNNIEFFEFGLEDIVRSPIIRYIIEVFEKINYPKQPKLIFDNFVG